MNVKDRVVLITGSGSGIGEATVKQFAKSGAKVVVNDLDQEKIDRVVSEIKDAGGKAIGFTANITNKEDVEALFEKVIGAYGRIDVLVNNAGIGGNMSIRKITEEYWDHVFAVNMKGVMFCSQTAARYMTEQKYGRIVNISSRAWLGWFGQTAYASAKGGVVSFTRSLAIELGKHNITVNCIAPGLIETPLLMAQPQEMRDRLMKAQPSGKMGKPEDIAWGVQFLSADESSFVTGQVLYVCGGKSLFAKPDL